MLNFFAFKEDIFNNIYWDYLKENKNETSPVLYNYYYSDDKKNRKQ